MKLRAKGGVTPQSKMIATNKKLGNPGIKKQQGSTIEIYDLVLVEAGKTEYDFFIDAAVKKFPLTNLVNNTLQPQESFIMERAYFFLAQKDDVGEFVSITPLNLTTTAPVTMGEFEFTIENQRVIKPIPLRSFQPAFNPAADNDNCTVLEFDTQIAIPPLLSFKATLRVPPNAFVGLLPPEPEELYIGFTTGGPAGIFAPKNNF